MKELPKAYEPARYEDDVYRRWQESGLFNPDVCVEKKVTKKSAKSFSIVLPPPNVTGTLHMGHATMLAIQDVLIRYHRMLGEKTLWVPGTDHAAIATESKVESLLIKEGIQKPKETLGREAFLKRVEKFAQESHDTIVNQCKKMGASLDWSREAFTLDEARSKAVRTMFKMMYADGLIYRGHRLVNWDPKMESNVADDEVEWREETVPFYYIQYGPFVIGTARPETKFGDKYVVMHPDDERYAKYTDGQKIQVEWINGPITATVIKDSVIDREFGTGVMTITPWHDAIDFDIAERHHLDKEQIIGFDGKLLPVAHEFAGMTIAEARPKIVEKLQEKGLIKKIDDKYVHRVAVNYRGGGVIEPQIKEQWFIDVNKEFKMKHSNIAGIKKGQSVTLKQLMQIVVKDQAIEIIPDRFTKTYFHWIDNLRDWCISRQIWYGHRIPVWYCENSKVKSKKAKVSCSEPIVSIAEIKECPNCGGAVIQDPDTLDTWFSSGLWTFSTLGWPDSAKASPGRPDDLKTYHPTSVLETGYDILFFWVARMILMATYALGDVPFEKVYLHGLVRDESGRKMSKSLGNIIDPLDMIAKYGTDATRLSLLLGTTPGNDMKLSEEKIAGFRNFTNKLWNISRFMLLNIPEPTSDVKRPKAKTDADTWILGRLDAAIAGATKHLDNFELSAAGELLREFTWTELADWYLEIAKIEGGKEIILNYLLNTVLKLWHPFMPFVTETIWEQVYGRDGMIMIEEWPMATIRQAHGEKEKDISTDWQHLQELIVTIRNTRSEHGVPPGKLVEAGILGATVFLKRNEQIVRALGRVENLLFETSAPMDAVSVVSGSFTVWVNLAGAVDRNKEKDRIQKEIATIEPYVISLEKKLGNDQFVAHAPPAVVETERKKLADAQEKLKKLQDQLANLK